MTWEKSGRVLLKKSGFHMHYYGELVKDKTPLLFVHSSGGSGILWLHQLRGLSEDFSTLAVDLPGHRFSEGQPATRINLNVDYLKDFVVSLGLPPFILIGHSLGGAITIAYALQHPADLQAMILISTGGKLNAAPKLREIFRQGNYAEMNKYIYGPEAEQELVEKGEKMLRSVPLQVFYADLDACEHFDVLNQLQQITLPTLIICGEQDLITPPKLSRFMAQQIRGSELFLLANCGHMTILEKPAAVTEKIRSYVQLIQKPVRSER
ncbi:MAG: alpha/beta fold hydrolase [Dethiobacteria bacterium]|jgi:pimeloyl-ACP methyl ester carboxylesterase